MPTTHSSQTMQLQSGLPKEILVTRAWILENAHWFTNAYASFSGTQESHLGSYNNGSSNSSDYGNTALPSSSQYHQIPNAMCSGCQSRVSQFPCLISSDHRICLFYYHISKLMISFAFKVSSENGQPTVPSNGNSISQVNVCQQVRQPTIVVPPQNKEPIFPDPCFNNNGESYYELLSQDEGFSSNDQPMPNNEQCRYQPHYAGYSCAPPHQYPSTCTSTSTSTHTSNDSYVCRCPYCCFHRTGCLSHLPVVSLHLLLCSSEFFYSFQFSCYILCLHNLCLIPSRVLMSEQAN